MAFHSRFSGLTQLERQFQGNYVIFGHIGDAHVHVNILPETAAQAKAAPLLMFDFARKAVELGGTVSAEQGWGRRRSTCWPCSTLPSTWRR